MTRVTQPSRRALLGAGLAGGAAAVLAGCDPEEPGGPGSNASSTAPAVADCDPQDWDPQDWDPQDWDPQNWDSVRAQLNLDPSLAQFAAFVLSPHTRVLDAAISAYRDELGRDTENALFSSAAREAAVRTAAAAYHGGVAEQYALTDSTTMGLGLLYGGLALEPGDEVVTTTHDFYSTEESLRLLHERTGATVTRVALYDEPAAASVDEIVSRLAAAITPRTKVVALTWVHSSTGVRLPVQDISAALQAMSRVPRDQYLLCVDGVHGFSAVDVDLPDLGCDFLSAGTHKWLFGPRGTGVLWGRDWGPLTEVIPTFSDPSSPAGRVTPGGYHSFEHRWAVADAFGFMTSIGRDRAVARTAEQATRLKEGLAGIDGITLVTPADPELSAGIVCLDVRDTMPGNAVQSLRERGVIASVTPYRVSYLRLGPSLATSPEHVDAALDAITTLV